MTNPLTRRPATSSYPRLWHPQQGHFLLVDPNRIDEELTLKEEALATKRDVVFAAEEGSLPAQQVRPRARLCMCGARSTLCVLQCEQAACSTCCARRARPRLRFSASPRPAS